MRLMILQFLSSLPKAAAIAIGTVAIAGGAVGAAASAGSGEIPRPVHAFFSALGFGLDSESDHDGATATPSHRSSRATATGTASALFDHDRGSTPGLCRAYKSGSENGREHKLEATAFKRLQNAAAAAGEDLDEYCDDHEVHGARRLATASATATAGTLRSSQSEHGKSESDSRGKSDEHRQNYSPAGIGGSISPLGAPARPDAPRSNSESRSDSGSERSSSGRR